MYKNIEWELVTRAHVQSQNDKFKLYGKMIYMSFANENSISTINPENWLINWQNYPAISFVLARIFLPLAKSDTGYEIKLKIQRSGQNEVTPCFLEILISFQQVYTSHFKINVLQKLTKKVNGNARKSATNYSFLATCFQKRSYFVESFQFDFRTRMLNYYTIYN